MKPPVKIDAALAAKLSPKELTELAQAYGGTGYIIVRTEKRRVMSPPRRPRGEKPQTTIRYLQRMIVSMGQVIDGMRTEMRETEIVMHNKDKLLHDALDRERIYGEQMMKQGADYAALIKSHQDSTHRLQFLEGYYAAHQETRSNGGYRSGNMRSLQDGGRLDEGTRPQDSAAGDNQEAGREIRREHQSDPAHSHRR